VTSRTSDRLRRRSEARHDDHDERCGPGDASLPSTLLVASLLLSGQALLAHTPFCSLRLDKDAALPGCRVSAAGGTAGVGDAALVVEERHVHVGEPGLV
jgi:hypothetical protein